MTRFLTNKVKQMMFFLCKIKKSVFVYSIKSFLKKYLVYFFFVFCLLLLFYNRINNKQSAKEICFIIKKVVSMNNNSKKSIILAIPVPPGTTLIYVAPYSCFANTPISKKAKRKLRRMSFDKDESFLALIYSNYVSTYYCSLPLEQSSDSPVFWNETDGFIILEIASGANIHPETDDRQVKE